MSDDYHLSTLNTYTVPKIIKFSDRVFLEKIKYIYYTSNSIYRDRIAMIYCGNSIYVFNVRHDREKFDYTIDSTTKDFVTKINNVSDVIFNSKNFTVCIDNKYYNISHELINNMDNDIRYIIIGVIFYGYFICGCIFIDITSIMSIIFYVCVTTLVFICMIVTEFGPVIRRARPYLINYRYFNRIDYDFKNETNDAHMFDDDTIKIQLGNNPIIIGYLSPVIKQNKSARFRGSIIGLNIKHE